MNMPNFLQKQPGKIEPRMTSPTPPSYNKPPEVTPEVAAFVDANARAVAELARLKSENEQMKYELKIADERVRMLDAELTHVRNERDWLTRHDAKMQATCEDVASLINSRLKDARADTYAQPGSGTQEQQETSSWDEVMIKGLAQKLAPDPIDRNMQEG